MKKATWLLLVLGLGLGVGLLWTRDTSSVDVLPTTRDTTAARTPESQRDHRAIGFRAVPVLAAATPLPSLEPTNTYPERRKLQEELWHYLRKFATDAKLTDAEWQQFQRDLSELAATESAAYLAADRAIDFTGVTDLNDELGVELEARCARYMTERQLAVLRNYRAWALITRVRQLHYANGPES